MKKIWPLIIILAFNLIFYLPVFSGKTPLPADNLLAYYPWKFYAPGYKTKGPAYFDVMNIMYPWKKLAVSEIKQGRFPLWNKYFGLGYPYFAAMQGGILYPTTLLFLILPFNLAWSLHIFLQTFLAGIFMYFLLRHYKLSELSSLFGALVFSFSGHFMVWLEYGTLVNAASWLPLLILLIELLFERRKLWLSLLIGLVLAVSFMAGFPQTTFYFLVFSFFYFIYKIKGIKKIREMRVMGMLGGLGLLGFLGLAAVQLLPFLEYLSLSTRKFANPMTYFSWSMLPTNLIGFIFPNFFGHPSFNLFWGRGNYQEFTVYLGIIPFILAVWAILKKKVPKFWIWALIGVAVFLIYNPLLSLFYKLNLPFVSKMAPSRLIVLLTFIMAVISSYGFEYFTKEKRSSLMSFLIIYLGILLFYIFDILFYRLDFIQQRFGYSFKRIFPEIVSSLYLSLLIIWFLSTLIILNDLKKISTKGVVIFLFFITMIDLYIFGRSYNPFIDVKEAIPVTKTINLLQTDKENYRFFSEDGIFPGNYSSLFGISSLKAVDTLMPTNQAIFSNLLEEKKLLLDKQELFNLANVKYYLSKDIINLPSQKLILNDEGVKIYRRNNFLPRYYFIPEGEEMILPIEIDQDRASKLTLEVSAPKKGKLIISNLYFPGWEAKVNNVTTKILPYKDFFQQININEGESLVKINYQPESFAKGKLISFVTLILITSYFVLLAVKCGLRKSL